MSGDRRYWDSDCFLGWLQAEKDKEAACREVLQPAEEGNVLIVTSALTIAEVLALKGAAKISGDKRQQVEVFFKSEYIAVINVTRRIAESARELVWDNGVRPKDALHIATAIDAKLGLFNTFDQQLHGKSGQLGDPRLIIEVPSYNQPKLDLDGGRDNRE